MTNDGSSSEHDDEAARDHTFQLSEDVVEGIPVLHLAGEIDLAAAPALRDRLVALAQQLAAGGGAPGVVLDLDQVSFIDSTGLSVLVAAHSRLGESGRQLRVAGAPPRVRRVLELTGLDGLLLLYADVLSALPGSTGAS